MTRKECEEKLLELMMQALKVYQQYQPEGKGIMASAYATGYCNVTDYDRDRETGKMTRWTVQAARLEDGRIVHSNFDDMTVKE